jgi:glycosyltransferase involved in cell wall biosynthesis
MAVIGPPADAWKRPRRMDEEALAPYIRHAGALEWLNRLAIEKPVIACVGYNRVMQDARVIKAAESMCRFYQPVLLGMSDSGGYKCIVENGLIGICCPNPELILHKLEFEEDDRLTATLELQSILLAPIAKALQPKLIHGHDVMGLQSGALLKLWLQDDGIRVPLIYDSHEYVLGLEPTPQSRAMVAMENRAIKAIDGLITVSESILDALRRDYRYDKPACLAFNCPPNASQLATDMPDLKTRLGLSAETPLGVWTGSVTFGTGAHTFVSALQFLPELHLAFLTSPFGRFFRDLLDLAQRSGCADRVHVVPTVDFRVVPGAIIGADFGFVGFIPFMGNHEFALPNKFFEYLQAEIPLVVSNLLEMGSFVARHRIGEVFEAESAASCAAAMQRVLHNTRARYAPGLKALGATYSWEYQGSRIEDLYAAVLEREIAVATPGVAMPRRFEWLEEPRWQRLRSQRRAGGGNGLTCGGVTLPIKPNDTALRLALAADPGQLNAIFKDLDTVQEAAGDAQAQILFDGAAEALSGVLADPARRLLPSPSPSGAGPDEPKLDLQLNLLQSLLLAWRVLADSYSGIEPRRAAEGTIRRLCEAIVHNALDRVECGGLAAGPPQQRFLLRSRWGLPAPFSMHGRAVRAFDRIAMRLESAEVAAVAVDLARSLQKRLHAWGRELGDEFPSYAMTLPLRRERGSGTLQPGDIRYILRGYAFAEYDVVPNRGLLGVGVRDSLAGRPVLQIEMIDARLPGEREREAPTRLTLKLPPGYAVIASGCRISTRDAAEQVVERRLTVAQPSDGVVECLPDLREDWVSMRQWRSDVIENSIVSAVSAAAAIFGLTRRSEDYEFLLWLADRAGTRLGSVAEVEKRLGWSMASVRKPLPLYMAAQ